MVVTSIAHADRRACGAHGKRRTPRYNARRAGGEAIAAGGSDPPHLSLLPMMSIRTLRPASGPVARYFDFAAVGTSYRREALGGLTTFLAMVYILFVNPTILGAAGMDQGALFTATACATIVGCVLMALVARYPVAVAPSMGLNAYFAYSVVLGMGIPWQMALVGVLLSGVLFVLITVLRLRGMIIDAIPEDLKMACACGIGLFIAFIGFKEAGIVVADKATLVTLGNLGSAGAMLSIFGLLVAVILMVRRVPGAIFFAMAATSALGIALGEIHAPSSWLSAPPSLKPLFGTALGEIWRNPAALLTKNMAVVVFTFLFVEFFDSAGTLIAVTSKAGLLKNNHMERMERALLSDSTAIVCASIIGTSPTNSYIESTTGVASGARTGFSTLVVAALFAAALFFSPLLDVVTPQVTAPALIIVGVFMASMLGHIQWQKFEIAVPAFVTVIMMPLTYSIADGIALGLVLYPITMVFAGRWREVHPAMYALLVVFALYFAL